MHINYECANESQTNKQMNSHEQEEPERNQPPSGQLCKSSVSHWERAIIYFQNAFCGSFVAIANGYGLAAKRINARDGLGEAIDEMLAHEGPYFLEVKVETEENIFPMIPSGCSVENIRLE